MMISKVRRMGFKRQVSQRVLKFIEETRSG